MAKVSDNYQDYQTKFVALNPTSLPKIINLSPTINMIPNVVQGKFQHLFFFKLETKIFLIIEKKLKEPDMHQKSMVAMIPDVEKHFQIVRKIGEGTFSRVYMAKLKNRMGKDSQFALKYLLPIVKP